MKVRKVFLLESDPLMFKAWEVTLRESSWQLYALDREEDFNFRVEEFGPDLVVISDQVSLASLQLDTQIPVVLLGPLSEEAKGSGISLNLEKPLDINRLENILDDLFTQISKN
ncbi:MAG: hypothetical protein CME63_13820 [Halobacteriovoraceae bacterium]|jgi:DNA-binding response OmpR family regulator|nr:hypothetical protein [Halobacteriovoraceae bacterium]|tara:strand:+ start:2755 stop:3093 length:339 start_codon:yes stop_codon:yes gene_type:complete